MNIFIGRLIDLLLKMLLCFLYNNEQNTFYWDIDLIYTK